MSKGQKDKINSINHCFKWIYTIIFYSGIICFRLKGGFIKKPTVIGILYAYTVRISLICGLYGGIVLKFNDEANYQVMFGVLSPLVKFIMMFECLNITIGYLLMAALMDAEKYTFIRFANRFEQLDEGLKSEFPYVEWNYCKTSRKYTPSTLSLVVFYIIISLIFFFSLAKHSSDVLATLLIALSYAIITMSMGSTCFLHIAMIDMLRLRYRLLQKLAKHHCETHVKYKDRRQLYNRIARIIHYCRNYIELILDVNYVFANVAAVGIFCDLIVLTNLTYLICQRALEAVAPPQEYVLILMLMLPRIYKVIMTVCYGRATDSERKKCVYAMCCFGNAFRDSTFVQQTLKSFLHWKMQQNYDFTVGKMMRCNLNVLFMVLNAISNFVLILIQLQFQQNSIKIANRVKNHDLARDVEIIRV